MSSKASINLFGITLFLAIGTLLSCDMLRQRKCEWYLVPEPKHRHLIEKGWVTLCAKNYRLGRQKCFLKAPLKLAEEMYGKPFRYSELKLKETEFPREVLEVKPCKD